MENLREINFDNNDIFLKDNVIKTSILPKSSKELKRNIKIESNTVFEGSVFGDAISIDNGDDVFKCAVFANKELHISTSMSGMVKFNKAVASADSIAALVNSGRVIFSSDVNAPNIRLKNCYIGGSVFGSEVYLENCVVLGGVFATKNLTISSCVFGTFNAPSVELSGVNYMLYPAAFSVEPLSFLPHTELYNISMAHLGALFKGEAEDEKTGKIKLDLNDDHQRTVLRDDDGSTITINSYSVSGRLLVADLIDFEKLENHFLIGAGALTGQILKVYSLTKSNGDKSEELTAENISEFFFKIISGKIQIQNMSGEISFGELKKVFE